MFMITNILLRSGDKEFIRNLRELYISIKGFEIVPNSVE